MRSWKRKRDIMMGKCSFFSSSDSAPESHLLLAPSRKLSAVKPGRKDIKDEWMLAQHFPLHLELWWWWTVSWTYRMLGRSLHCTVCWNYKNMLASKCKRVTAEDLLRLLPQACVWQSFGKELDGHVPKTLVELMGIFLLSTVLAPLLHFPRLKAVFSFS